MKFSLQLTSEAVRSAASEYDQLTRSIFLARYSFKEALSYFLKLDGKLYDSKAIAGVAHGYVTGKALTSRQFSGGEVTVAKQLRKLGFEVVRVGQSQRNPPWSRDELILALDLYMTNPASPPGKGSKEVQELSEVLNRLGEILGGEVRAKYRNPNGVYMKMMNFRRFDPAFTSSGRVGLSRGNKDEGEVWKLYASSPERLRAVADAIRLELATDGIRQLSVDEEDIEAEEGRLLTRVHLKRERNRALVERKKKEALRKHGQLRCEVCKFVFGERYGQRGQGFIEVHHAKPVHTLVEGSKTKLSDLVLVCSNCHRMIHRARPWLDIDQLKTLIITSG
ncbi:HNH endonuclease [Leptospira interrogans]